MCGISAYYGNDIVEDVLVSFLMKLEYRGYDSSGIAVKDNNNIIITKDSYKVEDLKSNIKTKHKGLGIGHTRWATHGEANKTNAHPHISNNKEWCVVHNGIIENFAELKTMLIENGYSFYSETDSEVIPNLLEYKGVKNVADFISAISMLKGSFAICAISSNLNEMYIARNLSPIYVSTTENGTYVSSDPICFTDINPEYYSMENNEFAVVFDNKVVFYDNKCNVVNKKVYLLNSKYTHTNKEIYTTFMEKEIHEIPIVFDNIIKEYIDFNYMRNIPNDIYDIDNIVIIGCGTAYHSGLIGATYLKTALNISVETHLASEYLVSDPIISPNSLYIFVSQSGETADTLQCLRLVKDKCRYTMAITNVVYSTLAKSVDIVLPVFAGPEIAVASTKAYNAQLLIFYLLAKYLEGHALSIEYLNRLKSKLNKLDISHLYYHNKLKEIIPSYDSVFILGKYTDYCTALEASLKLREITYHNISALPSGELKHGTLALITENTTCIIIATKSNTLHKNLNSIHEIKARGGKVILVTELDIDINENIDYIIKLPAIDESIIDIISIIPFQILALEESIYLGYNPDKPRNLAKSVTVE